MRKGLTVQKIALIGVLTALSLGIYALEAMIPVSNIGGIKLGLANVVTLCAMIFAGRVSAGLVLGLRIVLASAFYGTFISFMFSLVGGLLAYIVMCILLGVFDRKQLWVVSVFGAIAHNAGQLCVAAVVSGTGAVVHRIGMEDTYSTIVGTQQYLRGCYQMDDRAICERTMAWLKA